MCPILRKKYHPFLPLERLDPVSSSITVSQRRIKVKITSLLISKWETV